MLVLLYDLSLSKNSICIRLVRSGMAVIRVRGGVDSIILGIIAGNGILRSVCRRLAAWCYRFCLGSFDGFSWILIFLICKILELNFSWGAHILVDKLCMFNSVLITLPNAIFLEPFDFSHKFAIVCYNYILGTDSDLLGMLYDIFSCTSGNPINSNYSKPFSDISYISSTSHSYSNNFTNKQNKSPIVGFVSDHFHYLSISLYYRSSLHFYYVRLQYHDSSSSDDFCIFIA